MSSVFGNAPYLSSPGLKRNRPPDDTMNGMDHQKKPKTDGVGSPSRVIHIRSLPQDVSESEIKALGLPFGRVSNFLLLRSKHQAFLELESEESARTMVNYYQYVTPTIRTQQIYIQFSQHKELKTNNPDRSVSTEERASSQGPSSPASGGGGAKTVLKVIVSNIVYPVTIEVLQQVFQRCGEIQKIVTFLRNDQFHALIQYSNAKEASAARTLFDGQNIYNGCNTLHVEFSKLDSLNIKYNNEKSRDFTKPTPQKPQDLLMDPVAAAQMQMAMAPGMLPSPSYAPPLLSQGGMGMGFPGGLPGMLHGGLGGHLTSGMATAFIPGLGGKQGAVLLVSNLSEDEITCDDLFILFGHYGDVQRVKILFNKKDTALIQFSDAQQATTAQSNLNGVRLYGKEMRVSRSKHDNVNMPKSEDEGKELTKDYANSPLHRFKKPGSKNFQNIFSPIRTLHLSNIPDSTSEEDLRDLFGEYGALSNFRFFPKDRRMALIQMSSVEEALICLMKLHNFKLTDSSHLRVSFAKSEM